MYSRKELASQVVKRYWISADSDPRADIQGPGLRRDWGEEARISQGWAFSWREIRGRHGRRPNFQGKTPNMTAVQWVLYLKGGFVHSSKCIRPWVSMMEDLALPDLQNFSVVSYVFLGQPVCFSSVAQNRKTCTLSVGAERERCFDFTIGSIVASGSVLHARHYGHEHIKAWNTHIGRHQRRRLGGLTSATVQWLLPHCCRR